MIAVDPKFLGDLTPLDTYLYYDGPRSYSVKHEGRLFYCHQCDECQDYDSFLVREVNPEELKSLEENKIAIRDFLMAANPLYMVQVAREHFKVFQIDISELENDQLPDHGVCLSLNEVDG